MSHYQQREEKTYKWLPRMEYEVKIQENVKIFARANKKISKIDEKEKIMLLSFS